MPEKQTRKLAVVMFADIAGYTAMVQEDETAALAKVDIHRLVLLENTKEYGGQLVTFYGDGSLSTYPSAIDAVKCALQMQEAYREHNVPVRIGMHLGDIVYKGDSVYGDGVNIASRIESKGIPGSILLSAKLQQEIANHPEIQTRSLGLYRLKNVKKHTELYAVTNPGLSVPVGHKRASIIKKYLARVGLTIVLALLIGYFLYDKLSALSNQEDLELREQQVAVRFRDFAKIKDRLEIPIMASHWISNRLRAIPGARVINYENALAEPNVLISSAGSEKRHEFAQRTNAVTVLEGTIYRQGDRLLFEAHIYNLESGVSQKAFDIVECDVNDPMQGIYDLGNEILGWWATKDDIIYSVPNYKAYQLYLEARNVWKEDVAIAEAKLRESIAADTTFIDPYFLITELYSNSEDFFHRDSLLALIRLRFNRLTPRQRSLMDVYEADARGALIETYRKYLVEINSDPLDDFVNTAGMVQALQHVNKPREAIKWFNMIPIESLNIAECVYCQTRLRMATVAYLQLGEIDSAIYTAAFIPPTSRQNKEYKLKPFIVLQDTAAIRKMIREFNPDPRAYETLQRYAELGWHFLLQDRPDLANFYAELALKNTAKPNETSAVTVECNYLLGNYKKVIELLERQWPLSKYPDHDYVLMWTSRAYARAGSREDKDHVTQLILRNETTNSYGYGREPYMLGVMSLIEGEKGKALSLLKHAYERGFEFTEFRYQNDIDLLPLIDDPEFKKLINPLNE